MSDTSGTQPVRAPLPVTGPRPKGVWARLMRRKLALFGLGLIVWFTWLGVVLHRR